MSVMIKKGELKGTIDALHIMLGGEKQPDGSVRRYKVPPKVAYWLGRIARDLVPHATKYATDRDELIKQYGTVQGNVFRVLRTSENWNEFEKLATALADEAVECRFTVSLADFGDDPEIGGFVALLGDIVTADPAAETV